jgi:Flp pilus assembly pilin Flp
MGFPPAEDISPKVTMTRIPLSVTVQFKEAAQRGPREQEGVSVLYQFMRWAYNRMRGDEGATMVEYGLLIVLIALVAAVGAFALGGGLDALFDKITACLKAGGTAAC